MFESTIDTETADLLSRTQINDQNENIQRLLRQLGEANRDLIEALEADEKKHTVKRGQMEVGSGVVKQENVLSDFVRGPKGENALENACIL